MYNQGINVPINLNLSELQSKLSTTAPWGQKKVAVVERWPLWGGGGRGAI